MFYDFRRYVWQGWTWTEIPILKVLMLENIIMLVVSGEICLTSSYRSILCMGIHTKSGAPYDRMFPNTTEVS